MIALRALSLEDALQVVAWRNRHPEALRTPFPLTAEMQAAWYREVVCDRSARARFWAVDGGGTLVGMIGLVDIQWENGLAEISLMIDPALRRRGHGKAALDLVLEEAFDRMGLLTVWGECYECNPAIAFWQRECARRGAIIARLPRRKRWAGRLWDALHFSFARG